MKYKMILFFLTVFMMGGLQMQAQNFVSTGTATVGGDYDTFRFLPKYKEPRKIDSLASPGVEESLPLLSPDGNKLYFARTFHDKNVGGKISGHDIWVAEKLNDTTWGKAHNKFRSLNTKGNNAVVGITGNGNQFYLFNLYGKPDTSMYGLSRATKLGDTTFSSPKNVSLPNINLTSKIYGWYVSPNEDILLISMEDSTQGFGREDIYVLTNNGSGWSKPKNLGPKINTDSFEISPYLDPNGKRIYFSSNRDGGMGDADVYFAERMDDSWTNWTQPVNLGEGINSNAFDAYFMIDKDSNVFFVSTREGDLSDIYYTRDITDTTTKEDTVSLASKKGGEKSKVKQPNFIYFDFDKSNVKPGSASFLNLVADTLKKNPSWKMRLEGHADSIGTEKYNQGLSERRAQSTKDYLVKKGIDPARIETKGYGELKPLSDNGTESGRAKNRRVKIEFIKRENL